MPRFVLLFHECPSDLGLPSHWDFMLERDGALLTWRLLELPTLWQRKAFESLSSVTSIAATRLADHRLAYLEYEGPVSGGRGTVARVDRGEYRVVSEGGSSLTVDLNGAVASGAVVLSHLDKDAWRLEIDFGR